MKHWLVHTLLLFALFGHLGHSFHDHHHDEAGESCQVCIVDDLTKITTDHYHYKSVVTFEEISYSIPPLVTCRQSTPSYRNRAPPSC